jgi:hypothetical protein
MACEDYQRFPNMDFPLETVDVINSELIDCELKVMNFNSRSLSKHFDDICVLLDSLSFRCDVIVLTETQLIRQSPFEIPGYTFVSRIANHTTHDGVAVFYNNVTLSNVIHEFPIMKYSNSIVLKFTNKNRNYALLATYRSPCLSVNGFVHEVDAFVGSVIATVFYDCFIFAGDININIHNKHVLTVDESSYLNMLYSTGFNSLVNGTTRLNSNGRDSCLDHIMIRTNTPIQSKTATLCTDITDHLPTFMGLKYLKKTDNDDFSRDKQVKYRIDIDKLNELLERELWVGVFDENDPHEAMKGFYDVLNACISNSKIEKVVNGNKFRKIKPWITRGIVISIQKRSRLYSNLKNHERYSNRMGLPINEALRGSYITYRNMLNNLIRNCKKTYYENRLKQSSGNAKDIWKIVNEITARNSAIRTPINKLKLGNEIVTDSPTMANMFNKYFTNIASSLMEEMNCSAVTEGRDISLNAVNGRSNCLTELENITEGELGFYIDELKNYTAVGPDEISVEILKGAKRHILAPLRYLINLSLNAGIFPAPLKQSTVIPIYKAGSPFSMNNYRPITLVSQIAKIFEKAIKRRLLKFFDREKIISGNQYGFRSDMGTEDALYRLTSYVGEKLEQKKTYCQYFWT